MGLICYLYLMFNCVFVAFSCGILGQVWCLILSIPDLCPLSYFAILPWLSLSRSLEVTCCERTDLLALLYVMFSCVFGTFNIVSWARCSTWLYSFLVFACFDYFNIDVMGVFLSQGKFHIGVVCLWLCSKLRPHRISTNLSKWLSQKVLFVYVFFQY